MVCSPSVKRSSGGHQSALRTVLITADMRKPKQLDEGIIDTFVAGRKTTAAFVLIDHQG